MSSNGSFSYPELEPKDWVADLREMNLPEWGNVGGTLTGRIEKMGIGDVVEEYFSEEDNVIEVGCAQGYTSTGIANISGADVVGVDVPEAFSRGVSENKYGKGSSPGYIAGLAPELPFGEDSVDGVAALNSVTYLARSLGSLAAERVETVSEEHREIVEEQYRENFVRDILEDFERITKEGGYVLLGEQSDSSYLVLKKKAKGWEADDYGSFPDHNGKNIHRRFRPWLRDEKVYY